MKKALLSSYKLSKRAAGAKRLYNERHDLNIGFKARLLEELMVEFRLKELIEHNQLKCRSKIYANTSEGQKI